jgi:DNA-binding NarL/FixJ family response regulator
MQKFVVAESDCEEHERHWLDKWIEALTEMGGDEDQEDFYYRNRMISGSSNETMRSLAEEETTPTPPALTTLTPRRMSVKLHLKCGLHFPRQTIPKCLKRTRSTLKSSDKYDLGLLHKLMPGLPPIAQLFGDIK